MRHKILRFSVLKLSAIQRFVNRSERTLLFRSERTLLFRSVRLF